MVIPRLERIIVDIEESLIPKIVKLVDRIWWLFWVVFAVACLAGAGIWVNLRQDSRQNRTLDAQGLAIETVRSATERNADNIDRLSALTNRLSDDEQALLVSLRDLDKFLRDAVAGGASQSEASNAAIEAINRIEQRLCGGPCPAPAPPTTSGTG